MVIGIKSWGGGGELEKIKLNIDYYRRNGVNYIYVAFHGFVIIGLFDKLVC